jgi:hypothetical protein
VLRRGGADGAENVAGEHGGDELILFASFARVGERSAGRGIGRRKFKVENGSSSARGSL